jgi:NAD kinase
MAVRETRMMARALTQRWPVSPEYRTIIVKQLMKVIADPQSSPREKTAAAKALISAEKQNQDDEHKVIDIEVGRRHAELDRIAEQLGIDPLVIESIERESSESNRSIEAPRNQAGGEA